MPSAPASSSQNPWEIPNTVYLTEEEVERIGQSDEEDELTEKADPWQRIEEAEKRLSASQRPGPWIDKGQTARNRAKSIPSRLTVVNEDGQPRLRSESRPQKTWEKTHPDQTWNDKWGYVLPYHKRIVDPPTNANPLQRNWWDEDFDKVASEMVPTFPVGKYHWGWVGPMAERNWGHLPFIMKKREISIEMIAMVLHGRINNMCRDATDKEGKMPRGSKGVTGYWSWECLRDKSLVVIISPSPRKDGRTNFERGLVINTAYHGNQFHPRTEECRCIGTQHIRENGDAKTSHQCANELIHGETNGLDKRNTQIIGSGGFTTKRVCIHRPRDMVRGIFAKEYEEQRVLNEIYDPYFEQSAIGQRWFRVEKDHAHYLKNQATKHSMHINKMLGKDNSNIPQGNMDVLDKHNHIYINAETGIMLDYPFGEKDPVVNSRMDNRWGQMDEKTDWKPPQETVLPERDTVGFHDEAYKNWDGSTVPIIMVRW